MARDPYLRLMKRLLELHGAPEGDCLTCRESVPCDTMRAVWIYDLERQAD